MADLTAKPRIRPVEAIPTNDNGRPYFILRDPFHYSDAVLTLTPGAALIVQLMDGANTILDIQTTLTRSGGEIFPSSKIEEILKVLDECYFIDNERFQERKRRLEGEFARSAVRPAAMAGRSYPADARAVSDLLDKLFSQPDAAAVSAPADGGSAVGVISPHIDFARGGTTYTPAYRALSGSDAETFVIFGISHTGGSTPFIPTRKDFVTPLGTAETDRGLLDLLEKKLNGRPGLYESEFAHAHEHSIEFQVVFLQYVLSKRRPFKILPILCAFSHDEVDPDGASPVRTFLNALTAAIAESGRRAAYIAGVDFAHVGAQFGDTFAVREKELSFLKQRDEQMMALLAAGGPGEFHRFISEESNSRRVCGYPALYAFLSVLPKENALDGRVLKYGQWPDPNGTVTFGSLSYG